MVGVTTALGAIDKPAIRQWAVDQTVAACVANIDLLLNRTESEGFRMMRFYHKRGKEAFFDDPDFDLNQYHQGVLDDRAELGTAVHDYVEADLNEWMEPDLYRAEQAEMVEQYLIWKSEHEVEVHATEATVFGSDYAGTADIFAKIDGENWLIDVKTSRGTWPEHKAQLAALGAADTWMREVDKSTPGALEYEKTVKGEKDVSWWLPSEVPPVQRYGVLHIRPSDVTYDGYPMEPFCVLKEVSHEEIQAGYELFRGALQVRHAQRKMKALAKEIENEENE